MPHQPMRITPNMTNQLQSCPTAQKQVLLLLQDGVTESGVSLLYTVKAMDAGPIIAQERMHIDNAIQADSVLFHLFAEGTK